MDTSSGTNAVGCNEGSLYIDIFSDFNTKTHKKTNVDGSPLKIHREALLMSIHIVCFCEKLRFETCCIFNMNYSFMACGN